MDDTGDNGLTPDEEAHDSQREAQYDEPLDSYLPRIVDITRRSRIEAERRLLEDENLARHANVYYACLTTILTLLTLVVDVSRAPFLPFLSTASAIVLTMAIIYATSQNYRLQADRMKGCYTDLQELGIEISRILELDEKADEHPLTKCAERYVSIMRATDNHLYKDYLIAVNAKCKEAKAPMPPNEDDGKHNAESVNNGHEDEKSNPPEPEGKKQEVKKRKRPWEYYGIRVAVYGGPILLFAVLVLIYQLFAGSVIC